MNSTLLIIDDEANNIRAIERILDDEDYTIISAENGDEGLIKLDEERVDLILLDIMMPVLNGFGFLERFSYTEFYRQIPVCVMTGHADDENRIKAINLGADDFISKPINNIELITRLKSLNRMRKYQRDLLFLTNEYQSCAELAKKESAYKDKILRKIQKSTHSTHHEALICISKIIRYLAPELIHYNNRLEEHVAQIGWLYGYSKEEIDILLMATRIKDIYLVINQGKGHENENSTIKDNRIKFINQVFCDCSNPALNKIHQILLEYYSASDSKDNDYQNYLPETKIIICSEMLMKNINPANPDHTRKIEQIDRNILKIILNNPECFPGRLDLNG